MKLNKTWQGRVGASSSALRRYGTIAIIVLAAISGEHGDSFTRFVCQQSLQARQALLDQPFTAAQQAEFEAESTRSQQQQRAIEAADSQDFESFRAQYVSAARLGLAA